MANSTKIVFVVFEHIIKGSTDVTELLSIHETLVSSTVYLRKLNKLNPENSFFQEEWEVLRIES